MAVSFEERRLRLNFWQTNPKIVCDSVGETLHVEHSILVRDLAVHRIDVMIETYSAEAAEARVAQKKMEPDADDEWKEKRRK